MFWAWLIWDTQLVILCVVTVLILRLCWNLSKTAGFKSTACIIGKLNGHSWDKTMLHVFQGGWNSIFQFGNRRWQHRGSVTIKSVRIAVLFENSPFSARLHLNGFFVKIILCIWFKQMLKVFFICSSKITYKPMGTFAENLNLGTRVPPPSRCIRYEDLLWVWFLHRKKKLTVVMIKQCVMSPI